MVLDIIICVILLAAAIYGFRKGFIFTLIHTVGWVGAVVLAYLAVPLVGTFLREKTPAYDWVYTFMQDRFEASLATVDASMGSIPKSILHSLSNYSTNIVDGVSSSFANVIFTIFVFTALFIVIKVILWLLLRLLSKDYHSGFTNFFDGLFGTIFGLLKGGIFVLIFLVLLVPVTNMLPPGFAHMISDQMNSSMFAQEIYDNNFLLILLQGFFNT